MIEITKKTDCCGCTACFNVCPKSAIEMKADFEGFLYPSIDMDKCINCGLCEKVCPVQNLPPVGNYKRSSYALRTKDAKVLHHSTSGGFFTPLAEWVIENEGYVCSATYDKEFRVVHKISRGGVQKARGSKYVQSSLGDCFKKIKGYLEQKKLVCFVGTTCQVSGLKSYLRKEYENLITVDLVCHGTPSPKLWEKYLNYQKNKYHSDLEAISFRNKTYGYHSGTMTIRFSNGKVYNGSARVDYMLKSFFQEIASRPICYECPFKKLERCSDFTIYDCWHVADLVEGLKDDDKGYTNVIVQSEKGAKILDEIRRAYEVYPVDTQKAIDLDGPMVLNSAIPHPKRSEFYRDLDSDSLPEHVQKFIPVTKKDRLVERSKILIYRLGIYQSLKSAMSKGR